MTTFFLHRQCLLDCLINVSGNIRGRLLDLGCNDKPYERYLAYLCTDWTGFDRPSYCGVATKADVTGDVLDLQFATGSFDTVLCTQVLDDVPRPNLLFAECFRVLKAGGNLILSAPQHNPLHDEPNDYFRFTREGLRFLAEETGFRVMELTPVGGAAALVGRVLSGHIPPLNRNNPVSRMLSALVQHLFYRIDKLWFRPNDPIGWLIVCRKD